MLLDLNELILKYKLDIKGIIHIGAHFGQEYETYKKLNIDNLIFFEPLPNAYEKISKIVSGDVRLFNIALGDTVGEIEMYVEKNNEGMSSSILKPKIHLLQYPWIKFEEKIKVPIDKLDSFSEHIHGCNLINMDVQGYELEVLKGSVNTLQGIDYIITEINRDELYENCAREETLDDFLSEFGFERIETNWEGITWGDALYIKKNERVLL